VKKKSFSNSSFFRMDAEATERCISLSKTILSCGGVPFEELQYWIYFNGFGMTTMRCDHKRASARQSDLAGRRRLEDRVQPLYNVVCSTQMISNPRLIYFRNALLRHVRKHMFLVKLIDKPLRYRLYVCTYEFGTTCAVKSFSNMFNFYPARVPFDASVITKAAAWQARRS